MNNEDLKAIVLLTGYNSRDQIVYSDRIPLDDYHESEHIWDSLDKIKSLGLIKLEGKVYNYEGKLEQEFENSYSDKTGKYIGGMAKFNDGTSAFTIFTTGSTKE